MAAAASAPSRTDLGGDAARAPAAPRTRNRGAGAERPALSDRTAAPQRDVWNLRLRRDLEIGSLQVQGRGLGIGASRITVGPKSRDRCLDKGQQGRQTWGGGRVTLEAETGVTWPPAKVCSGPQKLGSGRMFPGASGGSAPGRDLDFGLEPVSATPFAATGYGGPRTVAPSLGGAEAWEPCAHFLLPATSSPLSPLEISRALLGTLLGRPHFGGPGLANHSGNDGDW